MMPTNWRKSRALPTKLRKNRANSCYRPRYDRSKYTSNSCFQPRFDSDLGQASMGLMPFDFRRMPIFHTLMLLQKTKIPVLKLSKCCLASWSMERSLLEPNLLESNLLERNLLENSYSWLSWMNRWLKSEIKEAKLHTMVNYLSTGCSIHFVTSILFSNDVLFCEFPHPWRLATEKSPGVFSQIFHFFELRQIGTFAYNHHATLTMKFVFDI